MKIELRNETTRYFTDISSEESRTYDFGDGVTVTINRPQWLSVSASGGHRLLDAAGASHYVPTGWVHLTWWAKDNQPHFVV